MYIICIMQMQFYEEKKTEKAELFIFSLLYIILTVIFENLHLGIYNNCVY